jgi:hypothetical protein
MRKHVTIGSMFALIACISCGSPLPPSSSAVGDWEGRDAPLHFEYLHIRFTQQGTNLQGIACYTSDVHVVFSGFPFLSTTHVFPYLRPTGSGLSASSKQTGRFLATQVREIAPIR